jgi:hypothetical protein
MNDFKNINELVSDLLKIPHQILMHSHISGLSDLLLATLASKQFFNLKKAVYLLGNPEFSCIRGMSGVEHLGVEFDVNHWEDIEARASILSSCEFNKKIKTINDKIECTSLSEEFCESLKKYASENLGFQSPHLIGWKAKHGNHGIFLCEPTVENVAFAKNLQLLEQAVPMLGMTHH